MSDLIRRLNASDQDFDQQLSALLAWEEDVDENVGNLVRDIIYKVRKNGDAALLEYTNKFDRRDVKNASSLIIHKDAIQEALSRIPSEQHEALEKAAERIRI